MGGHVGLNFCQGGKVEERNESKGNYLLGSGREIFRMWERVERERKTQKETFCYFKVCIGQKLPLHLQAGSAGTMLRWQKDDLRAKVTESSCGGYTSLKVEIGGRRSCREARSVAGLEKGVKSKRGRTPGSPRSRGGFARKNSKNTGAIFAKVREHKTCFHLRGETGSNG